MDLGDSGPRLERDKGKQIVVSQGTVRRVGPSVWGRGEEGRGRQGVWEDQTEVAGKPTVIPERLSCKCMDIC